MEIKKQLLIKVLTKLIPYRKLAEGILALIQNGDVDEETVDGILQIMSWSIKNIKKSKEKSAMIKWIDIIKKIQEMENKEKEKEWDIEALLDQI